MQKMEIKASSMANQLQSSHMKNHNFLTNSPSQSTSQQPRNPASPTTTETSRNFGDAMKTVTDSSFSFAGKPE